MTNFLYLVLHLACKVTFYFRLVSSVLVSVLRTSINVLSKSKSKGYVTWIADLTKLFLSVYAYNVRTGGRDLVDINEFGRNLLQLMKQYPTAFGLHGSQFFCF